MINRLTRYLYPTDQQLRILAGVPKEKPKKGKHIENGKVGDTFHVPRSLDITLDSAKITTLDVVHLKYYTEYQWLLDFSVYAAAVYIMTEVSNVSGHISGIVPFECVSMLYFVTYSNFFTATQVYNCFYPIKDEINLSMLWCSLVLGFALYPFNYWYIFKRYSSFPQWI